MAREEKKLSLDIVAYETKIPKNYIEFLENNMFHKFKSFNQCRDYLKIYCDYLDLNSENYIKILQRDLLAGASSRQVEIAVKQKKQNLKLNSIRHKNRDIFSKKYFEIFNKVFQLAFQWRKVLFGVVLITFFSLVFVNLFNASVKPPTILLESPLDIELIENIEVNTSDKAVVFKGRVQGVGELFINNKLIIQRVGGFFETENFPLTQAENKFLLKTRNIYGHSTEFIINLKRSDIISTQSNLFPIMLETIQKAGFVLVKTDNEIIFNDFMNVGDQIGINVESQFTVESSNYENIRILFGDKTYQMIKARETFEFSEDGLIRK